MGQIFADWCQALLDLIFPTCRCVCCGQESPLSPTGLCVACEKELKEAEQGWEICAGCPTFIPVGAKYCVNCRKGKDHWFDAARAVFPYQGVVRKIIQDFKYRGVVRWHKQLGALMQEAVRRDSRFRDMGLVIPVPLHGQRKKMRGYNQSELLAREIARGLGLPVHTDILHRVADTPSQTGLNKKGRQENLQNAFQTVDNGQIQGKNILLVDDIYTTGATVEACSRILKVGGAKSVFVVTCAAGKSHEM